MKTRFYIILTVLLFASMTSFSQDTTTPADTSYWTKGFKGVFTFNQTSFSNWVAGGDDAISLNSIIRLFANYNKDRVSWTNSVDMSYGFNETRTQGYRKTDDNLLIATSFGYKIKRGESKLHWTSSAFFRSQFTDGFKYPNDSVPISRWMAPGYLTINTGLEYKKGDYLSAIYSPLAVKWTFVQDDALAALGSFGVKPGEKMRTELGTTITVVFNKELIKNVTYDTKLGLFTNYKEGFGNIDVNWNNIFLFKVNDWLSSNLVFHFIYDDDIDIVVTDKDGNPTGEVGPRLQFRQAFGLGITLTI